jgi:hypothetical protein
MNIFTLYAYTLRMDLIITLNQRIAKYFSAIHTKIIVHKSNKLAKFQLL